MRVAPVKGIPYRTGRGTALWLSILPIIIFLTVFFFIPIGSLLERSFFDPNFTLDNYTHIFLEPVYLHVLWITFEIAAMVTVATVLIGYPFAYAIYRTSGVVRWLLLGLVLLPFWTSLLVRTFAFTLLLQNQGPINRLLLTLHFIKQPVPLVYNLPGVLFGMTYMLLPYFTLPLFSTMDRIDPLLEKCALGLGASGIRAFFSTVFPLSLPGALTGAALVFMLSLGFFVTPALLGGPRQTTISMLIESQVNQLLNWGFASALCFVLIIATLIFGGLLYGVGALYSRQTLKGAGGMIG